MDFEATFFTFFAPNLGFEVVLFRIVAAAVLGGIMGLEREYRRRPAGLRTHILVATAAATFTLLTLEMMARAGDGQSTRLDPIRVVEAVTAGVAFLAAGTIIHARGHVHGLTTGAGLWLAGAIGTACAVGTFSIAVIATLLGFAVLNLLRWLEDWMPQEEENKGPKDGNPPS